jgi:hypothetical protein
MVIRWLVHLKNGQTIVDGKGPEIEQIPSDQISSIESLSPKGNKVIVCANPFFKDFFTLVTASDMVNPFSGEQVHTEEERIIGFKVADTVIEVVIDCLTGNVKIKGRKS